jgi:hypothetical protein
MTKIENPHLYILLLIEGMYLFIPQDDVVLVEIIADVHKIPSSQGEVAWFLEHGLESPVFGLANDLSLLSEIPNSCEYFVLLKTDSQPLGITCDYVENINTKRQPLNMQDVPMSMRIPNSPIKQLVFYQDTIAIVCTGEALIKYLNFQLERFTIK